MGTEVRNICLFVCVCVSVKEKATCNHQLLYDLRAILQHELCEEIGQQAVFLSLAELESNHTQMMTCLNIRAFACRSSGDKQKLKINMRTRGRNHERSKSRDELLIWCYRYGNASNAVSVK